MAVEERAPGAAGQEAIIREIEQTRQDLARTIDAITDRVSPSHVAKRARDRLRERVQAVDPRIAGAGAVVVVGLVGFMIWRKRR
jgi:Protein of unknown function (DUF3618)